MQEEIKPGYVRVSSIASAFAGYGQVPKKILDYTADRGTRCHSIIYYLMNHLQVPDEVYMFEGKSVKGYIESFEKFDVESRILNVKYQERRFYDDIHFLTGQIDLLGYGSGKNNEGEYVLIDWKTSKEIGKHWEIQAWGYHELCKHNGIELDKIIFVKLDKEGGNPISVEYEPNPGLFYKAYEMYKRYFKDLKLDMENE